MVALLFGLVVSAGLCLICRRYAHALGLVCTPRPNRWRRRTVPLVGGIALFAATAISSILSIAIYGSFEQQTIGFLLLASIVFAVGLADDRFRLKPFGKLFWICIASAALVFIGYRFTTTPWPALNVAITLFWMVGITNALNLMDNMDGLAGGIAFIALFFRIAIFGITGPDAILSLALMGAVAGFLIFNMPLASIFMGDAGSLFLGFSLGALLIPPVGAHPSGLSDSLVPFLILLVPIFDTSLVTLSRILSGVPISKGGCDHVSHRLVARGLTESRAVFLLYFLSFFSGTIALIHYQDRFSPLTILGISTLFALICLLTIWLQRSVHQPSGNVAIGD